MDTRTKAYLGIAVLIFVYATFTLGVPVDPALLNKYQLSRAKADIINLSVILPFAAIWFAGVYGFVQIKLYSQLIKSNNDGKAFRKIAVGLGVLAFRAPIASTLGAVFNYYLRTNADMRPFTTITLNYLNIVLAIIAFTYISTGAAMLVNLTPKKPALHRKLIYFGGVLLLVGAYSYLALTNPGYQAPAAQGERATFYLPSWLIITTIIVPYVYVWYQGFIAAFHLYFYRKNVPGTLYKQGLHYLSVGIGAVIIGSILLQFVSSQGNRINKLNLAPLLFLAYAMLIVISVGFVAIAVGAKKLKRIEEV